MSDEPDELDFPEDMDDLRSPIPDDGPFADLRRKWRTRRLNGLAVEQVRDIGQAALVLNHYRYDREGGRPESIVTLCWEGPPGLWLQSVEAVRSERHRVTTPEWVLRRHVLGEGWAMLAGAYARMTDNRAPMGSGTWATLFQSMEVDQRHRLADEMAKLAAKLIAEYRRLNPKPEGNA